MDRSAATYCHADASRWVRMAIDHAVEQRLNVVLSATLGWAEGTQQVLEQFRVGGYRVEGVLVAVHEAHSQLGILQRYQDERAAVGYGRLVPTPVHDAAYTGVLDSADRIDEQYLADAVFVYRRGGGEPLYANQLTDQGLWREPPAARTAMETERARPWTGPAAPRPARTRRISTSRERAPGTLPPRSRF